MLLFGKVKLFPQICTKFKIMKQKSIFLLKKEVDWSLLRQGFTIPAQYQPLWQNLPGGRVERGEKRPVKFFIDGKMYEGATIINQPFDEKKFAGHSDVFQIRYNETSDVVKKLRQKFASSYLFISKEREARGGKAKGGIRIPEEMKEYLIFYASVLPDVFVLEFQLVGENNDIKQAMQGITEAEFESPSIEDILSKHDTTATLTTAKTLQKIRKLDRSIGDSLKKLYGYRCQMTGEVIGEAQDVHVVEAHHIEPFVTSLDNDARNQIILSPSYHRIIHQAKPKFERKTLSFVYPNGLVERVMINLHL